MRTLVAHPDPARANALALKDLQSGAASLLLRLDPTGETGIAAAEASDLARVLEGVLIDLAPVALEAGFMGPLAADWLAAAAKGAPRARLGFDLDPLSAFAEAGASPGPIEAHLVKAAQVGARYAETYPLATACLASGRAVHEAGGGEAMELGVAAACALAYAKALVRAGLDAGQAFARIAVALAADAEYFTTLAKLRAMRAIWARLTAACEVTAPLKLQARSSRRMLSRLDPWTNLLRLTAATFGAALGGAETVTLDPFTQPLGPPAELARTQARNIQLVLMEESALGRVADPAGGSGYVEALTEALARAGWAAFQAIEAEGGIVAALEGGLVAREVARVREARLRDIATRKAGLIGVSQFADLAPAGVEVETVDSSDFAKAAPATHAPGPDSACPPLRPCAWPAPSSGCAPGPKPQASARRLISPRLGRPRRTVRASALSRPSWLRAGSPPRPARRTATPPRSRPWPSSAAPTLSMPRRRRPPPAR